MTGIEWSAKAYDAWGVATTPVGYHKVSLFPEATARSPGNAELRCAFWSALEQTNPDVVAVNGWNNFGSLIAANCCMRRGKPMVVMSESSRQDEPRAWWKEAIKRRVAGLYSAALVGGQRHVEYLAELGMPRERIFTGYDVVDNDYFRRKRKRSEVRDSEVRQKYALPENYFLASARFIEKKNLPKLIQAYAEYRRRSEDQKSRSLKGKTKCRGTSFSSVMARCGGTLTLISDLQLNEHVHLPGFKPYDELPFYYALANAFVHASTTEQWGLVVNEAIASGLPVIVSDRCGCAPELVMATGLLLIQLTRTNWRRGC